MIWTVVAWIVVAVSVIALVFTGRLFSREMSIEGWNIIWGLVFVIALTTQLIKIPCITEFGRPVRVAGFISVLLYVIIMYLVRKIEWNKQNEG